MPRRNKKLSKYVKKRPDVIYNSCLIRQFACMLMKDGKYAKAYKKLCTALESVVDKNKPGLSGEDKRKAVVELINQLVVQAGPEVEVKTKRLGGATYPVPVVVRQERKVSLAFRWLIKFSRKRVGDIANCLTQEFLDVLANKGATISEKENLHRMAKANMAFANIKR
jgi:small subunit ribosomal protein S7